MHFTTIHPNRVLVSALRVCASDVSMILGNGISTQIRSIVRCHAKSVAWGASGEGAVERGIKLMRDKSKALSSVVM